VKNVLQPKQKRSIATKRKIKTAARKLFSKSGYYAVTSNMIAAKAKVPVGSFYNYFGNKKSVLLDLIKEFNVAYHKDTFDLYQETLVQITNESSARIYLQKLIKEAIFSPILQDPFYSVIHALQFTEPDVVKLSEEVRKIEIEFLVQMLTQIHQFHSIPKIPVTAKLIHATTENIGLYIHHLGTKHEQDELIDQTINMFLNHIFA